MTRKLTLVLATAALSASLTAHAGKIDNGSWTHACGPRPAEVNLDLKNPDAFNKSVGAVNTYRQAQRAWLDCLQKEGNADIQATSQVISQFINAEAQTAKQINDKIAADAKTADAKFGDGK
ncbi:hypothetical protein [Zoogloea sp. LCSB751]|uniref:hypothetical protein n=1 Tax=Zoogloea sp. LCSB751 TaxID=1965277 RepID=UPI0009A485DB|nr:hypothetical protein [Zoogloea sp. LCSB751]